MTLTQLHVLLTYKCNYACEHCFVWGSPDQEGAFSSEQLEDVFQQALDVPSINKFYFEGGEPLLYYPILVKAVARATELGFASGIVSNGFWATNFEVALDMLTPLAEAGLGEVSISSDILHMGPEWGEDSHPGVLAARQLGMESYIIAIDPPTTYRDPEAAARGESVVGGGVMYRGRAAQELTPGLPTQTWDSFTECPYEKLDAPNRVHLDPFGYLHLCQGLVMGNLFKHSLKSILEKYEPTKHPIVAPLLSGGPAELAKSLGFEPEAAYVDACHLCDATRSALRIRLPEFLAPEAMYCVPSSN